MNDRIEFALLVGFIAVLTLHTVIWMKTLSLALEWLAQ